MPSHAISNFETLSLILPDFLSTDLSIKGPDMFIYRTIKRELQCHFVCFPLSMVTYIGPPTGMVSFTCESSLNELEFSAAANYRASIGLLCDAETMLPNCRLRSLICISYPVSRVLVKFPRLIWLTSYVSMTPKTYSTFPKTTESYQLGLISHLVRSKGGIG